MARYGTNLDQSLRLRQHPRVSGAFALEKGLWDGRRVAVRVILRRGHAYQRGHHEYWYGTLVLAAGNDDQFGIRDARTGAVEIVHKNRVIDVYDLTRRTT